jgi:glycosyltransferase involved in cell wall biosynthesis
MVSTPFVPVPPPKYGGAELIVQELVEGLARAGHRVTLFATGDSRPRCRSEWLYERAVWPPHALPELAHAAWAAERIRADGYDVVHAHVAAFLPFARTLDAPVVYTVHHDRDEAYAEFYARQTGPLTFVTISRRQGELFPELGRRRVVLHGLDPAQYAFGARGRGYLAFLGRLSEVKGPDVAVDVARAVGRELRVGGRPHEIDGAFFAERLARRLEEPHVTRLGEVSHGPKVELLAGADALLFPIRWEEPFGLVMIEAMLCGCPVVAFPGGAVGEVVEPGVTGFLARDAEDMARLVRDEVPRLDRRRVRARAIERFSRRRMVDDYLRVFREAVAEHAFSRPIRLAGDGVVRG